MGQRVSNMSDNSKVSIAADWAIVADRVVLDSSALRRSAALAGVIIGDSVLAVRTFDVCCQTFCWL